MEKYQFFSALSTFDLDDFLPHIGWIGSTIRPFKIYSSVNSNMLFLHDEEHDKMVPFLLGEETFQLILNDVIMAYQQQVHN